MLDAVVPCRQRRGPHQGDRAVLPDEAATRRLADLNFSDEVQFEDLTICEDVQRGMASGSYQPGRLNPLRENAVHHFHEMLRKVYREASQ